MGDTVAAETAITIHPSDTEPLKFVFTNAIPTDGTLSSPSVASVSPSGELSFSDVGVNASSFNLQHDGSGETIAANKAVVGTPSGQVAGQEYLVTVSATVTDGSANTWTKAGVWTVVCRDF